MPKKRFFFIMGLAGIFLSPFLFDPLAGLIQRFGPGWAVAKISRINHLSFWTLSFVWAVYWGIWVWKSDWSWFSKGDLKRKLYLVLAGALAMRVALIIISNAPLGSDAKDYDRLAQNLAQTGRYEENGQPTAFRPVGYPAFLAGIYRVFGHNLFLPKLANVLFNMLSLLLLWKLFARWKNESVALKTATICAFYPPTLYTVQNLFAEHLFGLLWLASIVLWEKSRETRGWSVVPGFLFGLSALVRPVVLVWGLLPAASTIAGKRWLPLLSFAAAALVVTAPWLCRNHQKFDVWTLSTHTGYNLWARAYPETFKHPSDSLPFDYQHEGEMERITRRLAWEFVRNNPLEYFRQGLLAVATTFGFDYATVLTGLEHKPPYAQLVWGWCGEAAWWILLFFATFKTCKILLNRQKEAAWGSPVPLWTIAVWVAALFFFVGADRFHHPLVPFFAYLAVLPLSPKPETDRLQVTEGNRSPIQN